MTVNFRIDSLGTNQNFKSLNLSALSIIQAKSEHIEKVKILADANRNVFAFITRKAFEDAYDQRGLLVALLEQEVVGFVRYYHRKTDRQTTLYDICVAEIWRKQGVGKQLLTALILDCLAQNREYILLKCPSELPANQFYLRTGFVLLATQSGRKRDLNVWQLSLNEASTQ